MAGGKQTPRQRMINILYLVLLGLIALDAPANLLDAFKKIGDSLSISTANIQGGIDENYKAFQSHLKDEPTKAQPLYDKAKKASALVADLNSYIEDLKKQLIGTDGLDESGNYHDPENVDLTQNLMINQGKATELKNKINETRTNLIALLEPKDQGSVSLSLEAADPTKPNGEVKGTWEQAYFGDGIPMGAAMTTLIKVQSDAKNDESQVIKKILSKFDQAVVNLDKFSAVAVAPTSYVVVGQPYTAQVFLTASDSHSNPAITVNGSSVPVKEGQGTYTGGTSHEGVFTWTGKVTVKQADGTFKEYTTPPQTYQVARPSAVVSPDKMLVLYIGVDNPLSVSAPGISREKLHVSISNGSLTAAEAGKYMARVTTPGTATVTISGEVAPGKTQVLGSTEFRVKRIPDPVAQFAGRSNGSTSAVNLRAQDMVFAHLDNFEFEAKFTVTRFKMYIQKPHQDALIFSGTGNQLSPDMKRAMASIVPGTRVIFDDITAVGPDGAQRGLGQSIIITAN